MKMSLFILMVILSPIVKGQMIINHHSVEDFDRIPAKYKALGENTRLYFMDRSVGANISQSLDCLASDWSSARSYCKRYEHRDPKYAVDPQEVHWNGVWDRSKWIYETWPSGCSEDVDCFIRTIEPRLDSFDVVGCQFSYLAVTPGSKVADPQTGFFGSGIGKNHANTLDAFEQKYPNKKVVWWTTSLARGIGTPESQEFNQQMREYAISHQKILFDVADILSHAPDGTECYDNRDGIEYLTENHPDDGLALAAICPQYTTETEGGHLGSISAGGIRVSKAFWVLVARINGWNPLSQSDDQEQTSLNPLSIRPNPTKDFLQITIDDQIKLPTEYEILNSNGQRVSCELLSRDMPFIDVRNLIPGLYLIRLQLSPQPRYARFVKQ
ncbi:MAG: SGNH/GDSL hydrolase family protein [Saprospiraceae bacterium]|nr:SGNH/GDSL hydrolase family protein [Saprospiraceae bacterium]